MSRTVVLASFLSLVSASTGLAAARAEHITGRVVVQTDGPHRVRVFIDTASQRAQPDGFVDQWFTLESEESLEPLSVHSHVAQLEHAGGALTVRIPDQRRVYEFVVRGYSYDAQPVPSGFTISSYPGYGLAHHVRETEVPVEWLYSDALQSGSHTCEDGGECYQDWDDGGGGGATMTCDSGGRGSTSCSVEATVLGSGASCSVTCMNGYYACCSLTKGCKCIKY